MRGLPKGQSGQVLVLVAVAILALVGMTALALMAGSVGWQRNQLQTLADSAALDAAMKIDIGCSAGAASTVITEADDHIATQRTRTGSLAIVAGTCATPYHGSDTFAGGLTADYYYPYAGHQQQVQVVLTLTLPISFGGAVGRSNTTVTRYAVAQALPASMPAVTATTLTCTGGQVNVAGDISTQNAITLSGGCAIYAHQRTASGSYSSFGNVRVYTDSQSWSGAGGTCSAGANSGSTNAICADGYEISGHSAPACAGATDYLSAANLAVNANPCAAGTGRVPVAPLPSTLPPDPNADPAAIATLQGTGGSACGAAAVYSNITVSGTTVGTGQAPAPTKDVAGFWHFKPSCYGYLDVSKLPAGIGKVQQGVQTAPSTTTVKPALPSASTAGNLLVVTIRAGSSGTRSTAPAGWTFAAGTNETSAGRVEIWYRANAPATSTATFTMASGNVGVAEMTEWSGVATTSPLDQTGTRTVTFNTLTATVSTTGNLAAANELVLTADAYAPNNGETFTPGAGWTGLVNNPADGYSSEYRTNLGAGAPATETVTFTTTTHWSLAIASFKPAASGGAAVLDPGFYYFNGSGFAGGGGICLNGTQLLARDVTLEFVNQAGLSSGTCAAGGGTGCTTGACNFGSDPASAPLDTSFTWFAAPCSQNPSASPPDASCLGASSWCPAGDRSCWNLLVYQPSTGTGQIALKGSAVNAWTLGSIFWSGTCTYLDNGTSALTGSVTCGTLSVSAAAGSGIAIGSDYGISTATVEAVLVE